jgi:chromodomain-helicase-DNA-binding protein 7
MISLQLAGLNWMLLCHHYKRSCILADEMGLGKTVQVVTFLEHLMSVEKKPGPFLVIVPLSTVGHWEREFASWTDMNVCVYHDAGKDMRALIRAFEWYHGGVAPRPGVAQAQNQYKFQVLITTYDEVIKDVEPLGAVPWRNLVVDEAHRLKGVTSKLLESLHQILPLGVQTFGSQHRLLMTGTPLQNNTKELWSLLNFIEPGKFPSLENFQETYEGMDSEYQVRSLQQRLAPHLLRRVKEDVATDIPAKYETVIDVELTTIQKQYYRAIFEKNLGFLARAAKGAAVPKLMNIQMELRKCCNHPYLVEGVEEREAEALQETLLQEVSEAQALVRSTGGGTRSGNNKNGANDSSSKGAAFVSDSAFKRAWMERGVLRSSGKLVLLDKLLPKLRHEKHKVLIFSQMTRILNILEDFCEYRGFPVERLDGSITGSLRQASIDRFNEQADSFVFLLSTRAGGVGINLTAADTCIIFDR